MSGRKNKHKQRGQPRKQSSELLDELNSLHDLLNSDDLDAIPLLNQIAGPAKPQAQKTTSLADIPLLSVEPKSPTPPTMEDDSEEEFLEQEDLPILFSPVDETLTGEHKVQLAESDLALLRPLQDLPGKTAEPQAKAPMVELLDESDDQPGNDTQLDSGHTEPNTTDAAETSEERLAPAPENPFLPAHIRSRLTGGRIPAIAEPAQPKPKAIETASAGTRTQALVMAQAIAEREGPTEKLEPSEKDRQRSDLIEELVAQQLPQLEKQLRAQIEKVVDDLGIWD
ncbi:hypothetical protein [Microbulbifer variabilis]|uniref:hypothetical protein n=1 Tax=Microbulbifer variabilis TaxID=266805 RepID=UPI001CFEAE7F|nr:hypothetical protein [Microbulbifer variabilis]